VGRLVVVVVVVEVVIVVVVVAMGARGEVLCPGEGEWWCWCGWWGGWGGESQERVCGGISLCVCVMENGDLFSWGCGKYGQLGNCRNQNENLPFCVPQLRGSVRVVATDCLSTSVTTKGGDVFTFGFSLAPPSHQLSLGYKRHDISGIPRLLLGGGGGPLFCLV